MQSERKFLLFFLLTTALLFIRDTPYINVLIIDKLWIVYIVVFSILSLFFIPKKEGMLLKFTFVLLFISAVVSVLGISIAAEVLSFIIYILLCFVVILRIFKIHKIKSEEDK